MDEIIITGDDHQEIKALKEQLQQTFEVKDLGQMRYFLGMEVAKSKEGILISQRKYTLDLLKETGKLGCRPASTPLEPNWKVSVNGTEKEVDKERYQRLVGRLIYLSLTRPDISYATSKVSQYRHSPHGKHLDAIYHILRYLKGTPGKGILLKKRRPRNSRVCG